MKTTILIITLLISCICLTCAADAVANTTLPAGQIFANISIIQVLKDGCFCDMYRRTDALVGSPQSNRTLVRCWGEKKPVLITGISGVVDGDEKVIVIERDGIWQKNDVNGAMRTMEKWKFIRETNQGEVNASEEKKK